MLIPQWLHGTRKEVNPAARRFVKDVVAGRTVLSGPMVETANVSGLLLVGSNLDNEALERHFQLYLPLEAVGELPRRRDPPRAHESSHPYQGTPPSEAELCVFDELLKTPWGTLCLMEESVSRLQLDKDRRVAFLRTVLEHWPIYVGEGRRFGPAVQMPSTLWDTTPSLKGQLIFHGMPLEQVIMPLPDNDLRAFLSRRPKVFAEVLAP